MNNLYGQFTDSIRNGEVPTNGVAWGLTSSGNALQWVCYQQVGMFKDFTGAPITSISSVEVIDFCGAPAPFTLSIISPECGVEQWTPFAPWSEGTCLENTFIRIAVLNMSVQIFINGERQLNFAQIPTCGLFPNLLMNNCQNQFNWNGMNMYGRMNCVQDLYNILSTTITCSLGLDCYWFHTEPNQEADDTSVERGTLPNIGGYFNNEDYIFHEYRFSHVSGIGQFRVLLPDSSYPSGRIDYDPFDIMFEKPFTIEVNRKIFADNFGAEALPLPTDYVFFPMLNRAYSVNEMYKKDEENFLYNNSMFTCELQMYSNDTNVNKDFTNVNIPIPADIDSILGNYDDFFENGADIQANNSGFETTKMIGDMDYTNDNYEDGKRVLDSDYEKIVPLILCHDNKQFTHFVGSPTPMHEWDSEGERWQKTYKVNTCNDSYYYFSIIYKKKINDLNYKEYILKRNGDASLEFEHKSQIKAAYKDVEITIDTSQLEDDVWYCSMVGVNTETGDIIPSLYRYNQKEVDLKYPTIPDTKKHYKYKFEDTNSAVGMDVNMISSICDNIRLNIYYKNEIIEYTNVMIARHSDISPKVNSDVIFRDVLEIANQTTK